MDLFQTKVEIYRFSDSNKIFQPFRLKWKELRILVWKPHFKVLKVDETCLPKKKKVDET